MLPNQPTPGEAKPFPMMGRGERMAMEEIGRTEIRHAHAVVFVGLFLAFLIGVFLRDIPVWKSLPRMAGKPLPAAAALPSGDSAADLSASSVLPAWPRSIFAENRRVLTWIKTTEDHFSEQSRFARTAKPIMQNILAACGEGGTEVMAGVDGWLFYRPSFRFLTRPADHLMKPKPATARG